MGGRFVFFDGSRKVVALPGSARLCLALPGFAWLCLALPGSAWLCLALPSSAWLCLPLPGSVWLCLAPSGPNDPRPKDRCIEKPWNAYFSIPNWFPCRVSPH